MKLLVTLFLIGQFAMTPERQAAMDQAAVTIRSEQGKIAAAQKEQARVADYIVKETAAKAKLITDSKAKLGLDSTWSWSDTTNTFVQAK